jgi:hypothetical protein
MEKIKKIHNNCQCKSIKANKRVKVREESAHKLDTEMFRQKKSGCRNVEDKKRIWTLKTK